VQIYFLSATHVGVAALRRDCSMPHMPADTYHAVVHFSGRVQGVGFRYQTMQLAREYVVAGYVQNLLDGRVRLEAEGEEGEVGDFVVAVEERMMGCIRNTERAAGRRAPQFQGFTIR